MMWRNDIAEPSRRIRAPAKTLAKGAAMICRAGAARRCALTIASLGIALGSAAAQQVPAGMTPYDHPVFRNGHRVLWHGPSHGGGVAKAAAKPAEPEKAQAVAAPAKIDFTVLYDASDATAGRLAADMVAAMQDESTRGKTVAGSVAADALTKAVASDRAELAIVPLDSLMLASRNPLDWRDLAPYVARLGVEPLIVVASRSIADVKGLGGRKVGVDASGSATEASAGLLFQRLDVTPKAVNASQAEALRDLAAGKLDAVVVMGGMGNKALAEFGADGKFHVLALPFGPAMRGVYSPARLTRQDLPNLIAADQKIDTLAEPMALLALDAGPKSARLARAESLAKRFLANFDKLSAADGDPSWGTVNIGAELAQWPRLKAAQEWVAANTGQPAAGAADFRAMAKTMAAANAPIGAAEADKLYDSLIQWQNAKP